MVKGQYIEIITQLVADIENNDSEGIKEVLDKLDSFDLKDFVGKTVALKEYLLRYYILRTMLEDVDDPSKTV